MTRFSWNMHLVKSIGMDVYVHAPKHRILSEGVPKYFTLYASRFLTTVLEWNKNV